MNRRGLLRLSNDPDLVLPVVSILLQGLNGECSRHDTDAIRASLVEMIMNAIEHGNLAIGYERKRRTLADGSFEELIYLRRQTEPYASRHVMVEYCHDPRRAVFTIRDQGDGFDWRAVSSLHPPPGAMLMNGRGILIAREKMDRCVFHQPGNAVTLVKYYATTQREHQTI